MKRLLPITSVFCLIILFACKQDPKEVPNYELEGNWEMYEAYRNNSLTNTLEDGYFNFQDSVLETNIVGSPISGGYKIDENSFNHSSDLPVDYDITYYSKDTLHLKTQIQGFKFLFKLKRAQDSLSHETI